MCFLYLTRLLGVWWCDVVAAFANHLVVQPTPQTNFKNQTRRPWVQFLESLVQRDHGFGQTKGSISADGRNNRLVFSLFFWFCLLDLFPLSKGEGHERCCALFPQQNNSAFYYGKCRLYQCRTSYLLVSSLPRVIRLTRMCFHDSFFSVALCNYDINERLHLNTSDGDLRTNQAHMGGDLIFEKPTAPSIVSNSLLA